MRFHSGRRAALLAVTALAACSLLPEKAVVGRPAVEDFTLKGRVAVRYDGDGYTGTLEWRHTAGRDTVDLYGPIGTLYATLSRDATGATLETADGKRYQEADAAALSRRVLGWELPLDHLPHWLFGRTAPAAMAATIEQGADGRPADLRQAGWRVRYRAYMDVPADLPSRVDLDRPGLAVKLIVSQWRGVR